MSKYIKVKWKVDDGYVGGETHTTSIPVSDLLDSCDTEDQISDEVIAFIRNDFEQWISPAWDHEKCKSIAIAAWKEAKEQK